MLFFKHNKKRNDNMEKCPISNLNEMPVELIEHARKLGNEFEAVPYFELLVTPENFKYLRSFVRRVVMNHEEVSAWNKGRALIAYSSLTDQLTKKKEALYGYEVEYFKTIVKPNFEAWSQGSDLGGMFVFCEPNADYRSVTPAGYGIISLKNAELIEVDPNNVVIQFRRWLASRMAYYLKHKNQLETFNDSKVLEELAPKGRWSQDAIKAFKGLLNERENYHWGDYDIPGFGGTDSLYKQ